MINEDPQVSIIITTRDRAEMAKHALDTALSQTFVGVEVVVVDDGSNLPFLLDRDHPRVSVERLSEPRGVSAARNAGAARARGRWVTFLDDDDEILPEMLDISLRAAAASELPPPVAVVSGLEIVGPDGSVQKVRLPMSLPRGKDYFLEGARDGRSFTVGNTLVMLRDVFLAIGGFDETLRSAVHTDLLLRVNAACSIEGVPVVTYRLHRHHGANVHGNLEAKARAMERTELKHTAAFARHPRAHARYLSATGMWYLKAGDWGGAVRMTTRALRIDPSDMKVARSWFASLAGPLLLAPYRWLVRRVRSATRSRREGNGTSPGSSMPPSERRGT